MDPVVFSALDRLPDQILRMTEVGCSAVHGPEATCSITWNFSRSLASLGVGSSLRPTPSTCGVEYLRRCRTQVLYLRLQRHVVE